MCSSKTKRGVTRHENSMKYLLWWKRIFRNEIRSSTIKNFFSDKNLNTCQRAPDKNIPWLWTISFGKIEQKWNDRANYRSVSASGSYCNRNQISDFQGLIKLKRRLVVQNLKMAWSRRFIPKLFVWHSSGDIFRMKWRYYRAGKTNII